MRLAEFTDADITVFPETELGIYDTENKVDQTFRKNIIDASKQLGGLALFTVTEGNSVTKSKDERFISALLLNDGKIVGISRKRNLVPFSESTNYSKGKDYDVYETQFGKIGVSYLGFFKNSQKPIDMFPQTQGSKISPRHQSNWLVP